MNIKDILNSLNEKLKAGQVQDVKNDFVISGKLIGMTIIRYLIISVTCESSITLPC